MAAHDDLEALRSEYVEISARLFRGALITLALVLIVTVAVGRAMRRVSGDDLRLQLTEIKALAKCCDEDPHFSPLLRLAYNRVWVPEPTVETTLPADASERRSAMVAALEQTVDGWFAMKVSILGGGDLEIDLRYWIGLLPVLLWISSAYLWITRAKLLAVHRLGVAILASLDEEERPPLARLVFGGPIERVPFISSPLRVATWLYVGTIVGLVGYLIYVGSDTKQLFEDILWAVLELFFVTTVYVAAYAHLAASAIGRQADAVTNEVTLPRWPERLSTQLTRVGHRLGSLLRRRPRLSMSSGATIVMSSLFLVLARDCESHRFTGQQLIVHTGSDDVAWYTSSPMLAGMTNYDLGRWLYIYSIVLSAIVLVLVTLSYAFRRRRVPAIAILWPASMILAFFALSDLAFAYGLTGANGLAEPLRIVYFIIPAGLWLWFGLSRKPARRERWLQRYRPALVFLFTPAIVTAPVAAFIAVKQGFWGAVAFYAGAVAMSIGAAEAVEVRLEVLPITAISPGIQQEAAGP